MKVSRVTIGMLKSKPSLTEINFTRDSGLDHPLQGPINSRATNLIFVATHDLYQIIRTKMSFLAKKDIYDKISLARTLSACRAQTF